MDRLASLHEQQPDLSKPQLMDQSARMSRPAASAIQKDMAKTKAGPTKLDVKDSKHIPHSVAGLLGQWYQNHRGETDGNPRGAFVRTSALNSVWIPSSSRKPVFEDKEGRKLQAQIFTLKKKNWSRHGKSLVLIVWNDFQSPVIIKGLQRSKRPYSGEPRDRRPCRVWKGDEEGTDENGFLKESFIFKVEEKAICHDKEAGNKQAQFSNPTDRPANMDLSFHRSSPSLADSTQNTDLGEGRPDNTRSDLRQVLTELPMKLQILLANYYNEKGIYEPPVCSSSASQEIETTASGERIKFLDQKGQHVTIERFPTGFDGYVYLVAEGSTIIKHFGNNNIPRDYVVWHGGKDFSKDTAFTAVTDSTIAPDRDLDSVDTLISSQQVSAKEEDRRSYENSQSTYARQTRGSSNLESPTPSIKRSLSASVDSIDLAQYDSTIAQAKRLKLDPPSALVFQDQSLLITPKTTEPAESPPEPPIYDLFSSQATTSEFHQNPFVESQPLSTSTATPAAPAPASDRGSLQAQESLPNPASGLGRSISEQVDDYLKDEIELRFALPDGSVSRERPFVLCNNVVRLFSQARSAFNWKSTLGRILEISIPGAEALCTVVERDGKDFEDFVTLLGGAKDWHLRDDDGKPLPVGVSEVMDEDES